MKNGGKNKSVAFIILFSVYIYIYIYIYIPHHNYNNKGTEKQYCWNHFRDDFLQLMNDKNIDIQSESILL